MEMSRIKKTIPRPLQFEVIRDVFLNRDGIKIGQIVRWQKGRAYLTWRKHPSLGAKGRGHYFIKFRGFAIDKALLKHFLTEDKVDYIIIRYKGPRGLRYFISSIDVWFLYGIDIAYSKELDDWVEETYGSQKVLCEDYMDEYVVV